MMNSKKLMMVIAATILGLGLSACGRDDYNGAYSGSEIKLPQQQQQQQQPGQPLPFPQQSWNVGGGQHRAVSADLRHDGDIVTGTYNAAQQQLGAQLPTGGMGASETYRFEATSRSANRLEGVRLIPINSMTGAGCVLEGSLEAIENGRRLTGTLNPTNVGFQTMNNFCLPTQITLDRAR